MNRTDKVIDAILTPIFKVLKPTFKVLEALFNLLEKKSIPKIFVLLFYYFVSGVYLVMHFNEDNIFHWLVSVVWLFSIYWVYQGLFEK